MEVKRVKSIKRFFQNILLVIELTIYVAYVHFDKLLFVSIIALDQYTKFKVMNTMTLGESIPIFQDGLHVTFVLNPGAAFGILPYQRWFFVVAALILLIFAVVYYSKLKNMNVTMKYGGLIAVAGAIANMIDRLGRGVVVDFIDIRRGFPIFNIADMAIVVGTFIMIYVVMFKSENTGDIEEVRQP